MATRLQLLIDGDASGARRALDDVAVGVEGAQSKLGKFNGAMSKATVPAAATVASLAAVGKASFASASALEQSAGAVESVFGTYAGQVEAQAQQAAQNVGLAESQYNDLAAVLGAQLGNMGVSQDQLASQTDNLVGLGADLAATFGGDTSEAVAALSSLMRGERDPIERYGVSIKAADVEAKKAAMGLAGLEGEADAAATTQATLALVMDQTAGAQGAFAREAETAAGQQQRANAEFENAKAAQKHREDVERAKAEETRKALSGKAIKIVARGAEGGRLYGSVTAQEIADELFKQYGVKVEKRRIDVANIRNAGDFTVSVWLYAGITAEMTAKVEVG